MPERLSTARRATLGNGLRVVAAEAGSVPVFTAMLVVEAGSRYDPDGLAGLAAVTGGLLVERTAERSAVDLALAVESLGSSLDALTGYETTALIAGGLTENLPGSLDVLAEIVARPSFEVEDVSEGVRRQLTELADDAAQAYTLCRWNFMRTVFRGFRRANPVGGLPDSVSRISPDDVAGFHAAHFSPGRTVLAIVADEHPDRMVELVERALGNWRDSGIDVTVPPRPVRQEGRRTDFTVMDGRQVHISIGNLGIARSDPAYHATCVLDVILGDSAGFGSRLTTRLREEQGLAYVVESDASSTAGLEPGVFWAYTASSPDNVAPLVRGVMEELRRALREPPSTDELTAAVSYLVGRALLERETTESRAGRLVHCEHHGLGTDYDERYASALSSVTREDVLAAAQRVIDPERCSFVTVGPDAPEDDSLLDP